MSVGQSWGCETVQSNIVARQEGWLSAQDAAAFDEHVSACQACRRQLDADTQLRRALEQLTAKDVRTPAWDEVRNRKTSAASGRLPRWLFAPALGAAMASLTLIWITWQRLSSHMPLEQVVAVDTLTDTAPATHMLMAASDLGADANRAIVAASQLAGDW